MGMNNIKAIKSHPHFKQLIPLLGVDFGSMIQKLIADAERWDKELDIVHEALTECYEFDLTMPIVKKALDKINNLS